jgi:hypothetical protein
MQRVHKLRLHLELLQHTARMLLLLVQCSRTIPRTWLLLLLLLQECLLQVGKLRSMPKELATSTCTCT